jgi:hypothetical protein
VFLLLYLAVGVGVVLGAVSLNALIASDALVVRELATDVSTAERRYEFLVAEIASLEDPARIAGEAQRLGMIPADQPRFLEPERPIDADAETSRTARAGDDEVKPVLSAQR